MNNSKLLSVVVPTKDRYKYLKFLIDLIASFDSDEVELVIQDNSDNNTEFVAYLNDLAYKFIKYDHTKGQIPMAINSDKAILNSTGEYVCFLGDDDGLTRFTIDCAAWMKENGIEAVKSSTVNYYWSDISQGTQKRPPSVIKYNSFTGKVRYLSPYHELEKVLKKGITDRGKMPLVYHSIVKREVLDKVYKKVGTYFPGNSPDISNAVALSLTVQKYAYVDFPLAFSGWSVFHGGGVHATGKKGHPEINEVPWFRPDSGEKWDKNVPRIASGDFIWADSAISAIKMMGEDSLYKKINFNRMYANFIVNNPSYYQRVKDVCSDRIGLYISCCISKMKKYIDALFRRIGWFMGIVEKPILKNNISDIIQASKYLESLGEKIPTVIKQA